MSCHSRVVVALLPVLCIVVDASTSPFHDDAVGAIGTHGHVLHDWALQQGADVDKIRIGAQGKLGSGILFQQAAQPGDVVLQIPFAAAMTIYSAKEDPEYGEALRDLEERGADPLVLLVLHLLKERSKSASSHWAPYISALPSEYHSLLHFTELELALLGNTAALKLWESTTLVRYRKMRDFVQDVAQAWYPKLFSIKEEYLQWAFSTVASRAWEFGGAPQLVPLADMANHATGQTNLVRSHNGSFVGGAYLFRAIRVFDVGDSFFQSYDDGGPIPGLVGAKCDHHWLAEYGFLPGEEVPDEVASCVPLALSMPLEQLPEWKQALFHDSGLFTQQTSILADGLPSEVTLALIRLAFVESEGEAEVIRANEFKGQINTMNEIQALSHLSKMIKALLDQHRQSEKQDARALQDGTLTANARLALRYRLREKRTLQAALSRIKALKRAVDL